MILHIDLKNCYGIGRLNSDINYVNDGHTAVIYAPNGTMKTSLTNTFLKLLDNKQPSDELYPDRPSSSTITIDGSPVSKINVYVFANADKDGTSGISTFLANEELKQRYDAIFNLLSNAKTQLKNRVKEIAHSSDCESEVIEAFRANKNETYLDCLLRINSELNTGRPVIVGIDFKYNDVFDKGNKVRDFINENLDDLQEYFDKYQELIKESVIFSSGDNAFGTNHATALLKSIEDNRYFAASHRMILRNDQKITSKSEMATLISEEKERIFTDRVLKSLFEKLEKKLNANADLRGFKEVLTAHPEFVPELTNYDEFKKKVLRGYMQTSADLFTNLANLYNANKDQLRNLIYQATTERSKWESIIDMFNDRFFVPFKLELKNKADILLSVNAAPELAFLYTDNNGISPVEKEQKDLVAHLSRGEQKAFFILQNIFEIEARKKTAQQTLIVFDDVADSFDYKNKYAIIEYLYDIANTPNFYLLILTHNFDFYRTVVSRFKVNSNIFFAHKSEDRTIELKQGIYKPDILKKKFIDHITNKRSFIGSIPFVRNIIEYIEGTDNEGYKKLTSCLHQKPDTSNLLMSEIFAIIQTTIKATAGKVINFSAENYMDCLYNEAEEILADNNDIELSNKLVLSIAIRHKAESYMRNVLTAIQIAEAKENNNPTGELVGVFKKYHSVDMEDKCRILNRVLMLTSENIHLNNFMFEPLVDISILYLKKLYNQCKTELVYVPYNATLPH